GRTKATFGFAQSDLDQSGYETAGILADPFVLSWFKATRQNPARLGCFEGEVAHVLDTYLSSPHPVASMIRHAAKLLDRPTDDTPPLDPNNLPGDFDQAIAALCALVPDAPCDTPRGLLDPALRTALTPILWAIRDVARIQLERDADTSAGTPTFWQIHGGNLLLISLRGQTPDLADPAVREYLLARDHAPRLYAAAARLAFAIEDANLARFANLAGNDFEVETPIGRIRIWDTSLQEHEDEPGAVLLFVDTGGDDTYYGPIGATLTNTINPVSVAIDLAGNDTYTYRSSTPAPDPALLPADAAGRYGGDTNYGQFSLSNVSRQGGARNGVAFLFDLGEDDDTYRSLTTSQGYAHHGVGVLFDGGGDDTYLAESTSQGAAQFGIALQIDRGPGKDLYSAFTNAQGFAYVGGFGALVDGGGDDAYRCNHGDPNAGGFRLYYSPQMASDGNSSFCQGAGFGRRGTTPESHLSGGLGILRDVSGDDSYEASVFAQGTGYWQATGILSDGDGDDTYDAYYYAQGGAAHYAIGLLSDDQHDGAGTDTATDSDRFNTIRPGRYMHLGAGHDFSVGVLINEAGDDTYTISGLGAGASNCNGIGLFIDNRGDDTYLATSDYGSGMGNVSSECLETRPRAISLGVMIDASGTDNYTYPASDYPIPADNTTWGHTRNDLPSEGGAGVDTEGQTGVHPGG
ncbi:MAG TPA: hypothetical protein PK095_01030, partial [Myxococcota bacterium]|nr:hypothetical protein [Myxococcota bacterium]